MKPGISALVLSLLIFDSGNQLAAESKVGKPPAREQKKKIHQAAWQGENISGQVTINGFPISQFQGGPVSGTAPLNIWLTGDNEIVVTVTKKNPKTSASFSMGVSELAMGDIASTGDKGNLFNVELADADLSGQATKTISKKFYSALDFKNHLLSTKPSRFDEKAVLEYAVTLHSLVQKKDNKALLVAMSVKLEDYAKAYDQPVAKFEEALSSELTEGIFKSKLAKIDPKKLRAEHVNNLWHIYEGKEELIRCQSADGSKSELPIFVGEVSGQLMVVR